MAEVPEKSKTKPSSKWMPDWLIEAGAEGCLEGCFGLVVLCLVVIVLVCSAFYIRR